MANTNVIAIVSLETCQMIESLKAKITSIDSEIRMTIFNEINKGSNPVEVKLLIERRYKQGLDIAYNELNQMYEQIRIEHSLLEGDTYHIDTTTGELTYVLI